MQRRFEGMLSTMTKNVDEKMGIMQARMDKKDGAIKDLKATIDDMKARMDKKMVISRI
jgi:hypothetical protein